MQRKVLPQGLAASAVVLACGLWACGADTMARSASMADEASVQAALMLAEDDAEPGAEEEDEEDEDTGDSEDQCEEIRAQLEEDVMVMQETKEFRALAKTKEFKAVVKDAIAMRRKHCKMQGSATPACKKLRKQAYRHQIAMLKTPQFQALSRTKEFRAVMKDAREAMSAGCMDGMSMEPSEASEVFTDVTFHAAWTELLAG